MESTQMFAYGLDSRAAVKAEAERLIRHLQQEPIDSAKSWTCHNFDALDKFGPSGFSLKRFHAKRESEFLWDYIASDDNQGIYLVAESEKQTGTRDAEKVPLRHDFEKLLYVFAPLRLMLCKATDADDAKRIATDLCKYAQGCCANFPPGSAFILYCRVSGGEDISDFWQAPGDPQPMSKCCIDFHALR